MRPSHRLPVPPSLIYWGCTTFLRMMMGDDDDVVREGVLTFVLFVTRDGTTAKHQYWLISPRQPEQNLLFDEAATTRTCVFGFIFIAYLTSSACFSRRRHASVNSSLRQMGWMMLDPSDYQRHSGKTMTPRCSPLPPSPSPHMSSTILLGKCLLCLDAQGTPYLD